MNARTCLPELVSSAALFRYANSSKKNSFSSSGRTARRRMWLSWAFAAMGLLFAVPAAAQSIEFSYFNENGVLISQPVIIMDEESTATYMVALDTPPSDPVTVTITTNAISPQISWDTDPNTMGDQNTLTFDSSDYNIKQTVTLTSVHDDNGILNETVLIHKASSSDTAYNDVSRNFYVRVIDNDTPGIDLPTGNVSVTEQSTATFDYDVKLDTQPSDDVTITIAAKSGSDGNITFDTDPNTTGNQNTLTFTMSSWNTPQKVTLFASDDADGDNGQATLEHTASGGGYAGITGEVTVVESDNDTKGIDLPTGNVSVTEQSTATFDYDVKLDTQPSDDVTITIAAKSGSDGNITFDTDPNTTGNQNTLTFTMSSWNTPQKVTLFASDDADGDNGQATLEHTASGGGYAGITGEVTVVESDNDTKGIDLPTGNVSVTEQSTATFDYDVKLDTQPSDDVTITIAAKSGSDGNITFDTDPNTTGNQNTLTFTMSSWNTPQKVTLFASDDADGDNGQATLEHTASGGGYAGITGEVTVVESDNDTKGIDLPTGNVSVTEQSTATFDYDVKLDTQPSDEVTITIAAKSGSDGNITFDTDPNTTGNQNTLTFTMSSWNTPQKVTLFASDDADGDNGQATLEHTASGGGYAGITGEVTVVESDNDTKGIDLPTGNVSVTEQSTATFDYDVKLDTQPSDDVTITIAAKSGSDGDITFDTDPNTTGNQNTLTFTMSSWNTPQKVTLFASDDADGDNGQATLEHTASGGGYAGITGEVTVVESDNDTKGIDLPTGNVSVTEQSTATFDYDVKLDTQPSDDVTITIAAKSGSDGNITFDTDPNTTGNQNTLTFTMSSWNTPQKVTLFASDDADGDNGQATLEHTASGGGYAGITGEVTVVESDNDPKGIDLPTGNVSVTEQSTATFDYDVKLDTQPSDDVTITIAAKSGSDGNITFDTDPNTTGNQNTLTFTMSSWNTPQKVTLFASDDADGDNGQATLEHTASGGGYAGITGEVTVVESDNDTKGIDLPTGNVSVTEQSTATFDYDVKLDTQPSDEVTITIAAKSGSDGNITFDTDPNTTGNQNTLTFTMSSWNTPQKVTLFASDDADGDNGQATLEHTASGGGYAGITGEVTVVESDNDTKGIDLPTGNVSVTEQSTATFDYDVKLDTQPSDDVTITIAAKSGSDGDITFDTDPNTTGNQNTLTFTMSSWNTPQKVTLFASDDADGDNGQATLEHTASGGGYAGITGEVTVVESDNDTKGIDLPTGNVSVTEQSTATFDYDVKLDTQPSDDVTITIAAKSGSDGNITFDTDPNTTGNQNTLTFTMSSWNTPQKVTLFASDDADGDNGQATLEHTASGGGYAGITGEVTVVESDNDPKGIDLPTVNVSVTEQSTATFDYDVKLDTQPSDEVTITIAAKSGSDGDITFDTDPNTTGNQNTLTFTMSSWNTPQKVTLFASDDADGNNGQATLEHTASGGGYAGITGEVTAVESDNDPFAINLSPTSLTLNEGGTGAYDVWLATQPTNSVTVTITTAGDTQAIDIASPEADGDGVHKLTFTTGNWSVPQTVTLVANEDNYTRDKRLTITHTSSSVDAGYVDLTGAVKVQINDNDPEGIVFSAANNEVELDEGGAEVAYKVSLSSQPLGNVTVTIESSDAGAVSVSPVELTFTSNDYNKPRNVTLSAVLDDDGANEDVDITHAARGGGYYVDAVLTAKVTDKDRGITLSPATLDLVKNGDAVNYAVKLNAAPNGAVTIALSSSDPGAVSVNPTELVFTEGNYKDSQNVTLKPVSDSDSAAESVTVSHTASGGGYSGVSADMTAKIIVADKPPTPTSFRVSVAAGAATLTWSLGGNGGSPIKHWEYVKKEGDGEFETEWTKIPESGPDTVSYTLTGLTKGVTYQFKLRAVSAAGAGAESAESALVTIGTPSFGDATIPDQSYTQNLAITQLILPPASGGDGTLTYSLTPEPPAGLTFDTATRALSGTPAEPQESVTYTWTATDADGDEAALTFSIAIAADQKPSFGDAAIPDQSYVQDSAITQLVLPQATGGDGTLDYSLSPEAPSGLSFDAAARALSGTPAEPREVMTYTWTATDKDGDQASLTFTIEVERDQAPSFGDAVIPDQSYVQNSVIADLTLPEATDGNGTLTYALSPEPLPGLSFDAATRTLSGAPAELAEATAYTWTATDEDGDAASLTFTIEVEQDDAPSFDDAEIAAQSWKQNIPIEPLALPAASGGNGDLAYALTPEPPAGLSLDAAARALSGTPAEPLEETAYTWTATDADGDAVALNFTLTVEADLSPSFDGATVTDQRYELSIAIEPLTLPAASGGDGDLTYELSPEPPAGLTLDPARRTLSGTPVAGVAKQTYTWTVTDSDSTNPDSASLTFTIEVMAFKAADKAVLSDALAAQGRALLTGATTVIGERFRGGGATMASAGAGDDDSAGNQAVAAFDAVAGLLISTNPGNGPNMVSPSQPGFGGAMAHTSGAAFPATGFSRDAANQTSGAAAFPQAGFAGGAMGQMPGAAFPQSGFSGSDPTAPARENDSTTSYLDRLLWGRSFAMPLTTGAEGEDQREWTLWGAGDLQNFQGTPDSGRYDGELRSVYVGADTLLGERWLAGAALSLSQSELNYAANGGSSGQVDTDLTSVYPYIRGELSSGLEVWALGGFGRGEVVNELEESGLEMALGAAGLRRSLAEWSGFKLSVIGGAGYASLSTDAGDRLTDSLDANVQRVRLALEASGTGALAPYLQVGGLYDGGDGQTGAGVEAVAGLRYRGERLDFEARGRWLLSHAAQGYEEYGAMARLTLKSRADGAGLQLSLAPTWGAAGAGGSLLGGGEALLSGDAGAIPGMGSGLAVPGLGPDGRSLSLTSEIGYGLLVSRLNGLLKPMIAYDRGASQNLTRFGFTYEYLRSEIRDDIDLRFGVSWQPARAEMEADYRLEVKFLKTF